MNIAVRLFSRSGSRTSRHCRISTGFLQGMLAVATILPAAEAEPILGQYRRKHPRTWEKLLEILRAATGEHDPQFPLVRLHLVTPD